MKKLKLKYFYPCLGGILLLIGCEQKTTGTFETKEDSLKFATRYFELYPEENKVVTFFGVSDSGDVPGSQPINWEEVLRYKKQYDENPLIFNPKGEALKGFSVDNSGYKYLTDNKDIQGLYLRLARRDNGSFTVMVLGTDSKGEVLKLSEEPTQKRSQADSSRSGDLDHLGVCPDQCPPNFE